ncbi:MAG: glycosyltransferase [Candidatus Omnitrophota bacterium]
MGKSASIIIRTKNEERWITRCLESVFRQDYRDFEVIIVDNESTDKTLEKAGQFPVKKVIACTGFLPGLALNLGIRESEGDYIVCLSGHCVAVDDKWLTNLARSVEGEDVAGAYGRQEPMDFTPASDKRDLALVFGLDRKVQVRDTFFHNANSIIKRDVWEKIPFDENVTNIEDRLWAKEVIAKGYKIVYEPAASVYHYHGIHQNGDEERLKNVVRVFESIHPDYKYKSIDIEKLNIIAVIPVKGEIKELSGRPLMEYTVKRAKESKYIKNVIVSADNRRLASLAEKLGAEAPFIRDPKYSDEKVNIGSVLKYSLEEIEKTRVFPDIIVYLEITFPFRPAGFIDDMVRDLAQGGLDSVVAAREENKAIWKEKDGRIVQLDEGLTPRKFKDPTFIELKGLGTVTHPEFIREGRLLGDKIGIYNVKNAYSHMEVRSDEEFAAASMLVGEFFK